ncbi:hypothetical protein J3Q29_16840, partial [Bordetella holmesii]|nr:hypothetical protein [Bordetella holmesii]
PEAMEADLMVKVRVMLRKSENVGGVFAGEARRFDVGVAVVGPMRGPLPQDPGPGDLTVAGWLPTLIAPGALGAKTGAGGD